MRWVPAWRVGLGMVSRGEVALVIAAVGLANRVIDAPLYSATLVMALGATLVTPLLLRLGYRGAGPPDDERTSVGTALAAGG